MPYKDPEKKKAHNKIYNEAHKEEKRDHDKTYREANKEKIRAAAATHYEANREERMAKMRANYEANRAEYRARNAKRQASKIQAILPTTDNELIKNIYKQRGAMTEEHGGPYHVDHIIPLSIGGAHHQDNLRAITAKENMEKGDKYIPELGGVWADNKLARKNRKKYEAL